VNTSQAGGAELVQALDALDVIARIRDDGEAAFTASEERVQATAYLWIVVGSALKQFAVFVASARVRRRFLVRSVCVIASATALVAISRH